MTQTLLSFYLGKSLFAVDIRKVKEICRKIEYTIVPGASKEITGLFNMRGQIVTLINLGEMVGSIVDGLQGSQSCVVLKPKPKEQEYLGFLITRPGSVMTIEADQYEPLPANINMENKDCLVGVVKQEGQLLTIINLDKVFCQ